MMARRLAGAAFALLAVAGSAAAAEGAACDATRFDGEWSGSWWRHGGTPPAAHLSYTFESQNASHFTVSSKDAPWGKGPDGGAIGVLDADFATSGRLTISFPSNKHGHGQTIGGTVEDMSSCSSIWLDNKSVWCKGAKPGSKTCGTGKHPPEPPAPPAPPAPPSMTDIEKVFIVFSNHLDVGYTDNNNGSCAGAVVNRCEL